MTVPAPSTPSTPPAPLRRAPLVHDPLSAPPPVRRPRAPRREDAQLSAPGSWRVPSGVATASTIVAGVGTALLAAQLVMSLAVLGAVGGSVPNVSLVLLLLSWRDTLLSLADLVVLATLVLCIVWTWQSRVLVDRLAPGARQRLPRAWTWAAWLVPGVNLWFPALVVHDVRAALGAPHRTSTAAWWAGCLALPAGGYLAALVTTPGSPLVYRWALLPVGDALAVGGAVLALVLWARIVRTSTAHQRDALRRAG